MFLNNKGLSIVESLVAVLLTAVAIVSLMPMQDNAIKVMSRSDYLGRAAGIMQSELETQQNVIMNSPACIAPTAGIVTKTVYASSNKSTSEIGTGDASFTVETQISAAGGTNSWRVKVTVTWPNNTTGITNTVIASCIN